MIKLTSQSRKFCFIFTTGWLLVIAFIFLYGISQRDKDDGFLLATTNTTEPTVPCRADYFPADQCSFVKSHCGRITKAGLVPYLEWYYCSGSTVKPVVVIGLLLWLLVVFAGMATAADKFLAVNLASLVHSLQISESLAGVTIFAFGNGSSDLFSTFAAMNGGNGSLAIAELFGAAAFITTMVLGAIMILQPFEVDRKHFVADLICFILAASINLALISDGVLLMKECIVIIGVYIAFVVFVLIRNHRQNMNRANQQESEEDPLLDTENASCGPHETTSLIRQPTDIVEYNLKSDRRPSSVSSAKTLVVEQITEGEHSSADDRSSIRSQATGISDWASEYEHMADIPPFIKLCESVASLRVGGVKSFISTTLRFPASVFVGLTTITQPEIEHTSTPDIPSSDLIPVPNPCIVNAPERHPQEYWLLCAQIILGPQFLTWLLWSHTGTYPLLALEIACGVSLSVSVLFILVFRQGLLHPGQTLHVLLSTFGFMTATAWIYLIAAEAVALIETLGVISDINDALLGATIFAIGNSSDDMFANFSVAKRGHPILASAACLGGPMLNSLLGIGFGSLIQIIRGNYQPYKFTVPASLFVSAASLLTGLSVVLGYVLLRGGKLDRPLGYGLMALWVVFTSVNVYVTMKGK